jgi:deoxyribodipyrimidine photo-lyase
MAKCGLLFRKMSWAIQAKNEEMKALWWIKRDFRLSDNESLYSAVEECAEVLPFFCWEPKLISLADTSAFHLQAQWQALDGLRKSLNLRNSGVWEDYRDIADALNKVYEIYPFQKLYSHQETGNLATFQRDKRVAQWCRDKGVQWNEAVGSSVLRGGNADLRRVKLRQVDYRKQPVLSIPSVFKFPLTLSISLPSLSWNDLVMKTASLDKSQVSPDLQKINEGNAWKTLDTFLTDRGQGYSGGISSPNLAFTHGSRLSPHLAWGTISLRTVFSELQIRIKELQEKRAGNGWLRSLRAFQSRLYWRDHFIQRLEAFPYMEEKPLNSAFEILEYEDSKVMLEHWIRGTTGFPMVDACMRCLAVTGFLNFRMRAMVVSFACYGLHLSWKMIHPPLAKLFLDYEPGIHMAQIQMQAGVIGFNTIRVYSPAKQFLDQDPKAVFVKKWIPELRDCTAVEIANIEKSMIKAYPKAIVDLGTKTKEMKDRIFSVRRSQVGKQETMKVLEKHGSRKKTTTKQKKDKTAQLALFKI